MEQKDYYEILGVSQGGSLQSIKEAYRRLAFEYHPDRNPGDGSAVEKMKEINEAYAVLSNAEKRGRYDRLRQEYGSSAHDRFRQDYSDSDIFRGSDINQIFEDMAKAFGFRGFEEVFSKAYGQGYRTFEFHRPGVFGRVIIFGSGRPEQGDGRISQTTGLPGILVKLAGYAVRKMMGLPAPSEEKDRHELLPLDPKLAEQGGRMVYRSRADGKEFVVNIPPGIREGQVMRLKGAVSDGGSREAAGDLYLKVTIRKSLYRKVMNLLQLGR